MAAYGAMFAAVQPGARIALDRSRGWTRQLRITPLRARTYFVAKVLTAYLVALASLVLLYLAGASFGVHMAAGRWLEMAGLLLVGLAPFVAIGFVLGHLVPLDSADAGARRARGPVRPPRRRLRPEFTKSGPCSTS